ncbi:helix-turn-helix transcriptional regulator [Dactylosporangium vinaceum]|uniref:Helix-turn-helix domain-containing protein n=1 Tax=Dactylosporangium vinaceum TaxID=53362 RepID=A0ABV5M057_9ACTN|nr:helix-turn-helix transcriptional regulator [Dactylosporangium vinaceum]UAB98157.1 helix-turn-helix transcriptional regulator [Dactylosporangium vinaceum]
MLLRRVIGDALRARRQAQHRTLREVSTAANVSLGYLSEIERGQKEASSELLAAICEALGAALSEVLRDVSDTLALNEDLPPVLVPVGAPDPTSDSASSAADQSAAPVTTPAAAPTSTPAATPEPVPAGASASASASTDAPQARLMRGKPKAKLSTDAKISVAVHHDGPLKTTLRATRGPADRERDVVYAA